MATSQNSDTGLGRAHNASGSTRRHESARTITRLDEFRKLTAPLKAYYQERGLLRTINGVGSLDEIYANIKKSIGPVVDSHGPVPS